MKLLSVLPVVYLGGVASGASLDKRQFGGFFNFPSFPSFPSFPTNFPTFPTFPGFPTPTFSGFPTPTFSGLPTATPTGPTPGCQNSPTSRNCWSNGFNINTNYEQSWPNTGRTVPYHLTITNTTLSPEGVPRLRLAVNGQVPGPTITANWGDTLQITVQNNLQYNGTSMHWHGLRQLNSNPQDGTNGITECPIAPGQSKTYTFQATEYGTSWYHSHFSSQYGDGVQGPIVINGPASANYDYDLGPILVSDLFSGTAFQEAELVSHTGPVVATNYLLNGQNIAVNLATGTRPTWTFQAGKKYLIRFINTSLTSQFQMQIDNHNMTVVQSDFVPINPYNTSSLNIGIGQRYNVIVTANQAVSSYYLRAINQPCNGNQNTGLATANGIITYAGAASGLPTTTNFPYTPACGDEPYASLVPVVSLNVPSATFAAVASTLPVSAPILNPADNVFHWFLNGISINVDWANPTLKQLTAGTAYTANENVITLPSAGVWTYWILQNQFFAPHPIHLHGHDFRILGSGSGTFNSSLESTLNYNNPPRRDVTVLPGSGWTVIAFETDNPGAWLMHCHIAFHVGDGLALQFVEIPSQIPKQTGFYGQAFNNNCAAWSSYAATEVYNKTDSGLKIREDNSNKLNEKIARNIAAENEKSAKRHLHRHAHHVRRSI